MVKPSKSLVISHIARAAQVQTLRIPYYFVKLNQIKIEIEAETKKEEDSFAEIYKAGWHNIHGLNKHMERWKRRQRIFNGSYVKV
jgi:hypothetical protein